MGVWHHPLEDLDTTFGWRSDLQWHVSWLRLETIGDLSQMLFFVSEMCLPSDQRAAVWTFFSDRNVFSARALSSVAAPGR